MSLVRRLSYAPVAGLLIAAVLMAGCASTGGGTQRWSGMRHGSTNSEMSDIHTVAALPAHLTISQFSAGGVSEVRDDWTETARQQARATLEAMRRERIVYLDDVAARPDLADEIREVYALFERIDANLMIFGLSPMALPARTFDYSVGSIDRILEAGQADALLVIGGKDDIFTADRKVLAVVSVLASAVLTGQAVAPGSGTAHVSAALIARDGTILWWNFMGDGEIKDLRTAEGVRTSVQRLLGGMPRATAKPVDAARAAATANP